MRANFELFDFELGGSDMDAISASTEANPGEPALTPTSSTASPTKLHLAGTESGAVRNGGWVPSVTTSPTENARLMAWTWLPPKHYEPICHE